jgi:hypothetical protein
MFNSKIVQIPLMVLLCGLGAMSLGYMYRGAEILEPGRTYFQFTATGIMAGVFLASILYLPRRWQPLVLVLVFLLTTISAGADSMRILVRDAVYVISVYLSVALSLSSERFVPSVPIGKFVAWALVFAAINQIAIRGLGLMQTGQVNPTVFLEMFKISVLIGAGVGLGAEVSALAKRRHH